MKMRTHQQIFPHVESRGRKAEKDGKRKTEHTGGSEGNSTLGNHANLDKKRSAHAFIIYRTQKA